MAQPSPSDVYAETVAVFEQRGEPLTTTEIGTALDLSRRTAYKRLRTLADRGDLRTKKVGANARVWWLPGATSPAKNAGTAGIDEGAFRSVFDAAFDAMVIADDTGEWVAVNPATTTLFGFPHDELLGKTPASFTPPDYDVEAAWAEFLASGLDRGLYPFIRADGEERIAEFAATPNIRPGLHLSILRDVTDREATRTELERLNHLNTVLRGVEQATTNARTAQGLADELCGRLLESSYYQYAAFCTYLPDEPGFNALAAVGDDALLVALEAAGLSDIDVEAARVAVETQSVQVRRGNRNGTPPESDWLAGLDDQRLRSFAIVPVVHRTFDRGVLAIASDRWDAFDEEETRVLHDLGATVANAVVTLEQRRSWFDEEYLEVTLSSREVIGPLARVTEMEGVSITLEQSVPLDRGVVSYYVLDGLDPELLVQYLDTTPMQIDVRLIDQTEDQAWLEFRSYDSPSATVAAEFGGRVHSAKVEAGLAEIVVEVPQGTNVRELVSAFEAIAPDVAVVAQHHRARRDHSERYLLTAFGSELTDRQQTALELAFYAGYFDWPRQTTAEELADTLDIDPSTLHYHLRAAERKLLTGLFRNTDESRST